MLKFEYIMLVRRPDQYGVKYFIDEAPLPSYNDISLTRTLNILGEQGWELAAKENENSYILKRRRRG